jgi:hypothetical protein
MKTTGLDMRNCAEMIHIKSLKRILWHNLFWGLKYEKSGVCKMGKY